VPAIPLSPLFTSAPLPLGVGADAGQHPQPPAESISAAAGGVGEGEDELMDVDTWASHGPDDVAAQGYESGSYNQDGVVESHGGPPT
jgi:hypothetical protein